jgi:hypothetical protein
MNYATAHTNTTTARVSLIFDGDLVRNAS